MFQIPNVESSEVKIEDSVQGRRDAKKWDYYLDLKFFNRIKVNSYDFPQFENHMLLCNRKL